MSDSEEDIFKTASDSDEDEDEVSVNQAEESDNEKEVGVAAVDDEEDAVEEPEEEENLEEDVSDAGNESDQEEEEEGDVELTNKKIQTKVPQLEDDDSDEEEDEDENYLQKFDTQIRDNYVNTFHPECITHNYQEISALTKVVRDKNNIIIDPLHRTIPFLTKYEFTRVIGQRAKQINSGAKPFVKIPENVIDGVIIAEIELAQKRIPFIIRRPFPGGGCEYWNLKDLEMIK
jgi:DNA-directed RNA polymerase subunit K/omega